MNDRKNLNAVNNNQEENGLDDFEKIIKATKIELYLDSIKNQAGIGI